MKKNIIRLPWQYLPVDDGGVCDEGYGGKGWAYGGDSRGVEGLPHG